MACDYFDELGRFVSIRKEEKDGKNVEMMRKSCMKIESRQDACDKKSWKKEWNSM